MPNVHRRILPASAVALLFLSLLVFGQTPDNRSQRLDRLEAAVQAEEGVRAVKRLQHTYSHYLEFGLWPDLADLFSENAVAQFKTETITGKANLRTYFMAQAGRTELGLAEGQLNSHLTLQPIINLEPEGKTAKGTWHEVALLGKFGSAASWRGGIYENEYTLENGVWKISRLHFYEEYTGAYEDWGHKAPPKWNIPYHFDSAHVGVTIPASALNSSGSTTSQVSAGQRLARLAQRVQRMNDETDVQNLQHSYGYYLDRKLWDDVADLFSDEGSMEVGQQGVYAGKSRIRRALEVLYGKSPLRTGELFDHLNLDTVVTIAPGSGSARARTSQLSMLGVNGEYGRWELGIYENEFVKQNGVWKIRALHYYPRMATDYEKGWAKDAKPVPSTSSELPPDRRSSQAFESYPKMHYLALHYANPVTGKAIQYPAAPIVQTQVVNVSNTMPPGINGANMDSVLAEVERKLDAAIGVDAVENLNSSYGYYLDESAWDQMADTFAKVGGAKEISGAGVYVGQDRIRKILNLRGPRGGRGAAFFTIHQLTQPVIHISEDGNSAKARLRLFQSGGNADGSTGSWIGGLYENTAVKEDGEWKFGVQDLHHTFNAPYRTGWAKMNAPSRTGSAAAGPRLVTEMPPDRQIRSRQYAFPEIDEPAFHYKNPVTGRLPAQLLP